MPKYSSVCYEVLDYVITHLVIKKIQNKWKKNPEERMESSRNPVYKMT